MEIGPIGNQNLIFWPLAYDFHEAIGLLLSYWSGKKIAGGGSASITTNSKRLQIRIVSLELIKQKDSIVLVEASSGASLMHQMAIGSYWQLPMVHGASEMAAFVTKHGLHKLVVMPLD